MNYSESTRQRVSEMLRGLAVHTGSLTGLSANGALVQGTTTIFNVYGRILLFTLFGEVVTAALDAHAATFKYRYTGTTPAISVADLTAASDSTSGLAVGQRIVMPTATVATKADIAGPAAVGYWPVTIPLIIGVVAGIGVISLTQGGADLHSGSLKFSLYYAALDKGSYVSAAV